MVVVLWLTLFVFGDVVLDMLVAGNADTTEVTVVAAVDTTTPVAAVLVRTTLELTFASALAILAAEGTLA